VDLKEPFIVAPTIAGTAGSGKKFVGVAGQPSETFFCLEQGDTGEGGGLTPADSFFGGCANGREGSEVGMEEREETLFSLAATSFLQFVLASCSSPSQPAHSNSAIWSSIAPASLAWFLANKIV